MGDGGKYFYGRTNRLTKDFNRAQIVKPHDDIIPNERRNEEYGARRIIHPQIGYFNDFTRPELENIVADLVTMHLLPPLARLNDVFGKPSHHTDKEFIARATTLNKIQKEGDADALIRKFVDAIQFSAVSYLQYARESIKDAVGTIVKNADKHKGVTDLMRAHFGIIQSYGYKPLVGSQITIDDVRHVQRMPDVIIAALTDYLPEDAAEQLIAWRRDQARLMAQNKPEANF